MATKARVDLTAGALLVVGLVVGCHSAPAAKPVDGPSDEMLELLHRHEVAMSSPGLMNATPPPPALSGATGASSPSGPGRDPADEAARALVAQRLTVGCWTRGEAKDCGLLGVMLFGHKQEVAPEQTPAPAS